MATIQKINFENDPKYTKEVFKLPIDEDDFAYKSVSQRWLFCGSRLKNPNYSCYVRRVARFHGSV